MIAVIVASNGLLARLSHAWGYVTLGATSIIAEEAAPVLAGFAAHQGHLHVMRALLACAIGSWVADLGLYALGFSRAVGIVRRWPRLASATERLLGAVRRHPWRASLGTRFAYGARLILPVTCGAARVPPGPFLLGSATSALVWSGLFTGLGWVFGQTAVELVGHIQHHEDIVAAILVVIVTIAVLIVTKRNEKRVPGEIGGDERSGSEAAAGATDPDRESHDR
jgi:membrane protein DedA with SNARE-associated domain